MPIAAARMRRSIRKAEGQAMKMTGAPIRTTIKARDIIPLYEPTGDDAQSVHDRIFAPEPDRAPHPPRYKAPTKTRGSAEIIRRKAYWRSERQLGLRRAA